MLEIMRSHKFFSIFLLSAVTFMIIITFVFWGIGPKDNPLVNIVADVKGEKITLDEYWRAYDSEYKRLKEIYPNEEEIKKLNIQDRVIDRLIDRRVVIIAAKEAGIRVTDDELQYEIMNIPYFQRDGVFDPGIYERALKLNRLTPQIFEEQLKNDLIFTKMIRLITEATEFTPEEQMIIESFKRTDPQMAEAFFVNKSSQVIKAYVEGLKRQMTVKINRETIS